MSKKLKILLLYVKIVENQIQNSTEECTEIDKYGPRHNLMSYKMAIVGITAVGF